jgi:hypothetical protein
VGSLLRHFLLFGALARPIPCLPGRMSQPPRTPVLIAAAALPQGRPARPLAARGRAVAITPITVSTEKEHAPAIAARTDHEPEGIHAPPWTGHGGGQSRAGVRRQGAGSRAPMCDSARGPGVLQTPGSHPSPPSAEAIYRSFDHLGNRRALCSRLGRISTSSEDQRQKVRMRGSRRARGGVGGRHRGDPPSATCDVRHNGLVPCAPGRFQQLAHDSDPGSHDRRILEADLGKRWGARFGHVGDGAG